MLRFLLAILMALFSWLFSPLPDQALPPELRAMIETEREFARTASIKGVRDAFLDFFADDSILIGAEVGRAKDALRKRPPQPFSVQELTWEPRVGDVATSGEIGWLSGPSIFINRADPHPSPRYGNYLSIWRKQPNGTWRVYIDMGTPAPEPVPFAAGFKQIASADRFTPARDAADAGSALAAADQTLNGDASSRGLPIAYGAHLLANARLHRNGMVPIVGREAIALWFDSRAAGFTGRTLRGESARSGDLGFTFGTYQLARDTVEKGSYLRVWSRDREGRWWVAVDVAQPAS